MKFNLGFKGLRMYRGGTVAQDNVIRLEISFRKFQICGTSERVDW